MQCNVMYICPGFTKPTRCLLEGDRRSVRFPASANVVFSLCPAAFLGKALERAEVIGRDARGPQTDGASQGLTE